MTKHCKPVSPFTNAPGQDLPPRLPGRMGLVSTLFLFASLCIVLWLGLASVQATEAIAPPQEPRKTASESAEIQAGEGSSTPGAVNEATSKDLVTLLEQY